MYSARPPKTSVEILHFAESENEPLSRKILGKAAQNALGKGSSPLILPKPFLISFFSDFKNWAQKSPEVVETSGLFALISFLVQLDGAGYGNRTRLCGLGSDRSSDELTLHIKLLEQGTGILRRLRRLRVPAHFLLALPKAAMPCIAPSYDGKMLVIEPAFRGLEDTAFCR